MKILLAALLVPLYAALPSYAAESGVSIRLAEVKGGVWVRATPQADWVAAKDGVMLVPDGKARTGAGASVVLAFSNGNKVHLGPKTTFGVESATTLKTALHLFSGRLSAWVKKANKADFSVRHAAGVAAVRGTIFSMEVTGTGMSIQLFEGALDVVDNFGRQSTLRPGQSATVTQGAGLQGIVSLPPGIKTPVEPNVALPPSTEPAPEDVPATDSTTAPPPQSPAQESATTPVSPSAP